MSDDNRELVIRFKQVHHEGELSHWKSTIEFDGEQYYEETGMDLRDAADRIYVNIWKDDTTIPQPWRDKSLPWEDIQHAINFDVPPSAEW